MKMADKNEMVKLRVSIPGAYIAVEMTQEQGHKTFQKMTELLLGLSKKYNCKEPTIKEKEIPEALTPSREPDPIPEPEDDVQEPEQEAEEEESSRPDESSTGYGGFLYIKCPECGKIKGFCAKMRIGNYKCECGKLTKLKGLVPMYMNCECGRNARYLTNMTEPEFDVTCYDCGAPVAVAWNEKRKQYETIRN